jgi:hypothetical protein
LHCREGSAGCRRHRRGVVGEVVAARVGADRQTQQRRAVPEPQRDLEGRWQGCGARRPPSVIFPATSCSPFPRAQIGGSLRVASELRRGGLGGVGGELYGLPGVKCVFLHLVFSVCVQQLFSSGRISKSHPVTPWFALVCSKIRRIAPRGCSRAPSCSSCWCFLYASSGAPLRTHTLYLQVACVLWPEFAVHMYHRSETARQDTSLFWSIC